MATEPESSNGHGAGGIMNKLNLEDGEQILEQTRAAVDQAVEVAAGFIRERPIICLAGALALGYVIGKIVSR